MNRLPIGLALLGTAMIGCAPVPVTPIASGFDIRAGVRAPLAEDGRVGVIRDDSINISDGTTTTLVDLVPHGLVTFATGKPVQIRSPDDVVFAAKSQDASCLGEKAGVYRISMTGGSLTTLTETCNSSSASAAVRPYVGMGSNGTVGVSTIQNGNGAILRGPSTGPLTTLRSGTGTFFNTRDGDANNSGQVVVGMEYFDGVAGGLMRGVPVFSTPGQDKAATPFAIEKTPIGELSAVAINSSGTVALTLSFNLTVTIAGVTTTYPAGVYRATPTLWNTPKSMTQAVAKGTAFCRIGQIDINDAGTIVFEATFSGGYNCSSSSNDALILVNASGVRSVIAYRGEEKLGDHRYFDSVILGEINNAGQVSFTTTYSEPLVDPYKVWRAN